MGIGTLILTFLIFVTQEIKNQPSVLLATKPNFQAGFRLIIIINASVIL
jgi:hypothetical protein